MPTTPRSRRASIRSRPDAMGMEQIEHIVLLMMENRSFDHYLGALTLEGRNDVNGYVPGAIPVNTVDAADPADPGVAPFAPITAGTSITASSGRNANVPALRTLTT